jgi:hypothetical protein
LRQFHFHIAGELDDSVVTANNFDITVGWSNNLMDSPNWDEPKTVNLQKTDRNGNHKADFRTTGRYLSLRFDFDDTGAFVMTGGDLDAEDSHGR